MKNNDLLNENYEHSFGIIPISQANGEWSLFLVQHRHGHHWGFPKGHPQIGESPKETAQRELYEETGLKIKSYLNQDPITENYEIIRDEKVTKKYVTYYIAEVEGEPAIQHEEISQFRWVPLSEAHDEVTFPESKNICRRVQNLLY